MVHLISFLSFHTHVTVRLLSVIYDYDHSISFWCSHQHTNSKQHESSGIASLSKPWRSASWSPWTCESSSWQVLASICRGTLRQLQLGYPSIHKDSSTKIHQLEPDRDKCRRHQTRPAMWQAKTSLTGTQSSPQPRKQHQIVFSQKDLSDCFWCQEMTFCHQQPLVTTLASWLRFSSLLVAHPCICTAFCILSLMMTSQWKV